MFYASGPAMYGFVNTIAPCFPEGYLAWKACEGQLTNQIPAQAYVEGLCELVGQPVACMSHDISKGSFVIITGSGPHQSMLGKCPVRGRPLAWTAAKQMIDENMRNRLPITHSSKAHIPNTLLTYSRQAGGILQRIFEQVNGTLKDKSYQSWMAVNGVHRIGQLLSHAIPLLTWGRARCDADLVVLQWLWPNIFKEYIWDEYAFQNQPPVFISANPHTFDMVSTRNSSEGQMTTPLLGRGISPIMPWVGKAGYWIPLSHPVSLCPIVDFSGKDLSFLVPGQTVHLSNRIVSSFMGDLQSLEHCARSFLAARGQEYTQWAVDLGLVDRQQATTVDWPSIMSPSCPIWRSLIHEATSSVFLPVAPHMRVLYAKLPNTAKQPLEAQKNKSQKHFMNNNNGEYEQISRESNSNSNKRPKQEQEIEGEIFTVKNEPPTLPIDNKLEPEPTSPSTPSTPPVMLPLSNNTSESLDEKPCIDPPIKIITPRGGGPLLFLRPDERDIVTKMANLKPTGKVATELKITVLGIEVAFGRWSYSEWLQWPPVQARLRLEIVLARPPEIPDPLAFK